MRREGDSVVGGELLSVWSEAVEVDLPDSVASVLPHQPEDLARPHHVGAERIAGRTGDERRFAER